MQIAVPAEGNKEKQCTLASKELKEEQDEHEQVTSQGNAKELHPLMSEELQGIHTGHEQDAVHDKKQRALTLEEAERAGCSRRRKLTENRPDVCSTPCLA